MSDNVQVLIESSPLRGTNGTVWGPGDMIYQGSGWSNAVFVARYGKQATSEATNFQY